MVRTKRKVKANASISKAESFDSPDHLESVIAQSGPPEMNIEEYLDLPGEEERKDKLDEEVQMEGVDDEEIDEEDMAEMIVEGSTADAEYEEKGPNAEEWANEEKEVPNETNIDGAMSVPQSEDEEDDSLNDDEDDNVREDEDDNVSEDEDDNESEDEDDDASEDEDGNVNEDRDDLVRQCIEELDDRDALAVCETNAPESMVPSESEVREENMEVALTNETGGVANKTDNNLQGDDISGEKKLTGGVANKTDNNLQGDDISGEKKLKKPIKKIIKKKLVVHKGKEATNEVKPQPADVNANELVMSDAKVEIELVDKVKNLRKVGKKKKVDQRPTVTAATIDDKQDSSNKNKPVGKEELIDEQHVKGVEKRENKSDRLAEKSRKRSRLKAREGDVKKATLKDKDRAETSKKSKKKVVSMGMIFMCSSKTKKDCYRYKVMGLPATKKDVVLKIYKGMRLFLFDFDLRLLYGIYKAAGPGGYNIEPRAFNSEFPSQVRFSFLEDCLPLGEEKFRKAIEDNYYTRNKFSCELSSEQVKNLCKLFQAASKGKSKSSKPEHMDAGKRTDAPSSSRKWGRSRRRAQDDVRRDRKVLDGKYDRRAPHEVRHDRVVVDDGRTRQGRDEVRRDPVVMDNGYDRRPLMYEREVFVPAITVPAALAPPIPQVPARGLSYVYGRTSVPEVYQRDVAYELRDRGLSSAYDVYRSDLTFEHHDRGLPSLGVRFQGEPEAQEPYASYRQSLAYRDPLYPAAAPVREYYDYSRPGLSAEYHLPAARSAAYSASETNYRRY